MLTPVGLGVDGAHDPEKPLVLPLEQLADIDLAHAADADENDRYGGLAHRLLHRS